MLCQKLSDSGECSIFSMRLALGSFTYNGKEKALKRIVERQRCKNYRQHGGCRCRLGMSRWQAKRTFLLFCVTIPFVSVELEHRTADSLHLLHGVPWLC